MQALLTSTSDTLWAPTRNRSRRRVILPIAIGVFATLVSLTASWVPSLWGDEAASLLSAERPLPSLFHMLGHVDAVHGTYYLALHGWIDVFGPSPFSIRLPSALAVGACAAAVTLLALRLGTGRLALIAGVICAVLPRLTGDGEEARSYALDAAIAAWLTVIVVEIARRRDVRAWWYIAYALLTAVGVYSFVYLALVPVAHILIVVAARPTRARATRWAVAAAAGLILATPIMLAALAERAQVAYLAHRTEVTPQSILVSLWFGDPLFATIAWSLIAVALGFWVVRIVKRRAARAAAVARTGAARLGASRLGAARPGASNVGAARLGASHPSAELVAAVMLFAPSILLIGSNAVIADFTARYLAFCAPAAALLMACGVERLLALQRMPSRTVLGLAIVAIVAAAVPAYVSQRGPYAQNNSDWNQIASVVARHARPGDAIVFDGSTRPSRRPRLALDTDPAAFGATRDLLLDSPYEDNNTWHDTTYSIAHAAALGRFDGVRRVWLVDYAIGHPVDQWGRSDLEPLGFHEVSQYRNHRSEVALLTR
jgi:mannosyltransferase